MKEKTVTTSPAATVTASFDESGDMFISKVSEPPMDCQLCGAEAESTKRDVHPGPKGSNIVTYYCCGGVKCLCEERFYELGEWNALQSFLLGTLRGAYEDGFNAGCDYELGHEFQKFPQWAESRFGPKPEDKKS